MASLEQIETGGTTYNLSVPFIVGTGSTAGTWLGTLDGLTEYYDGLLILYKPSVAGASTTTLNLNSLGAKTCYLNSTTKLTTHYPASQPILLVYSASQNSGCWMASDYNYNSDTHRVIKVNGTQALASNTTALNLQSDQTYGTCTVTDKGSGNIEFKASGDHCVNFLNLETGNPLPVLLSPSGRSISGNPDASAVAYHDNFYYDVGNEKMVVNNIDSINIKANGVKVLDGIFTAITPSATSCANGSFVTVGTSSERINIANLSLGYYIVMGYVSFTSSVAGKQMYVKIGVDTGVAIDNPTTRGVTTDGGGGCWCFAYLRILSTDQHTGKVYLQVQQNSGSTLTTSVAKLWCFKIQSV